MSVRATVMPPSRANWAGVRRAVLAMERDEWEGVAFPEEELAFQFVRPDGIIALALDKEELVGFACAAPQGRRGAATAYLYNILVRRPSRGMGISRRLLGCLEAELLSRGFRRLEMHARVDNGFADALVRSYGERARVLGRDRPSIYGEQRPLRIELGHAKQALTA